MRNWDKLADPLEQLTKLEELRAAMVAGNAVMTPEIMAQVIERYHGGYYIGYPTGNHSEEWKDSWLQVAQPEWFDMWVYILQNPSIYKQLYGEGYDCAEALSQFSELMFFFFYDLAEMYPRKALMFTIKIMDDPRLYQVITSYVLRNGHLEDMRWLVKLAYDKQNLSHQEIIDLKRVLEGIEAHAEKKKAAQRLLQKLSQHKPTNE